MKITTRLWMGLAILIVLTPLGLMLPRLFKAGDAWGEWGTDGIKELVGYIPQGLGKLSSLWKAPLADYSFQGWEEKGLSHLSFAYIVSAAVGIAVIAVVILLLGKLLAKK